MAMDIQIQDENGNALARYKGPTLGLAFLKLAPAKGACLRFVLPWADATFNQSQIKELAAELQDIINSGVESARLEEAKALLKFISNAKGAHTYVKFIGD